MTSDEQLDDVQAYAQKIADAAPPLTDYQRERLAPLLRPIVAKAVARTTAARHSKKAAA